MHVPLPVLLYAADRRAMLAGLVQVHEGGFDRRLM
jgi:hypothetical protein